MLIRFLLLSGVMTWRSEARIYKWCSYLLISKSPKLPGNKETTNHSIRMKKNFVIFTDIIFTMKKSMKNLNFANLIIEKKGSLQVFILYDIAKFWPTSSWSCNHRCFRRFMVWSWSVQIFFGDSQIAKLTVTFSGYESFLLSASIGLLHWRATFLHCIKELSITFHFIFIRACLYNVFT